MVMAEGMLNITPELEEQGRMGDTEVGFVEPGSIVIPKELYTNPELSEMFDSIKNAIDFQKQNPDNFIVKPNREVYAYNKDNAIPAHLTTNEFVIPAGVVNISPDIQEAMPLLFAEAGYDISNYRVGDPNNRINPETGYPEFWGIKIGPIGIGSDYGGISVGNTSLSDVGRAIKRGLDSVVDFGKSFVKSLGQGVEDLFEGDLKAVLENPAVIATASFMFPQYGAYINLGSKAATGQKITTADLVSAGFSASTDFAKVKIDPKTVKAVTTAAQIADGTDPVQALASNYGANWLDETGIGDNIKSGVRTTVGDQYANRIFDTIDLNQAVADYAAGNSTERILANQFGDEVVGYLGAESPSEQALGFAGIETAVQKAEGASDEDALLAGAQTYYDRGGKLPDAGQIASLAGIEDFDFDYNQLVGNLGLDFSGLSEMGYDLRGLGDLGIDLNKINLTTSDIFGSGLNLGEVADLGLDLRGIDFSGYSTQDLGGYNLKQLQDLGVDLTQLNLRPEFQMIGLAELLEGDVPGGVPLAQGEELATLTPDLDFLNEGDKIPLPRQLLSKPV